MLLRTTFTLFFLTAPAYALDGPCYESEKIKEAMARKYKEIPIIEAPTDTQRAMTIYARKDLSTWSLVIHYPNGTSCIKGSGYNLQIVKMIKGIKI